MSAPSLQIAPASAATTAAPLPDSLLGRVLDRLDVPRRVPDHDLLVCLYAAWCQSVPFDNVRKLIHVRAGDTGQLPGGTAEDFFEAWLRHGTGGTCWAGAGALHTLLCSLGFPAQRGIATMLATDHPDLPPNHGTVLVVCEGQPLLLDTAMLSGVPVPLTAGETTEVPHPAWGLRTVWRDGKCVVQWRALHRPEGFECRLEHFGAPATEYAERYEKTRGWSPFNFEVNARLNRPDGVAGLAFGNQVTLAQDGTTKVEPIGDADRRRLLVERLGMSEEIIAQLPEDTRTPPPPGSATAQREAGAS